MTDNNHKCSSQNCNGRAKMMGGWCDDCKNKYAPRPKNKRDKLEALVLSYKNKQKRLHEEQAKEAEWIFNYPKQLR